MEFKLFQDEIDDLVELLTKNQWEFHGKQIIKEESVRENYQKGYYQNDRETYWIIDNGTRIGIIIINDISDSIPNFDMRFDQNDRGKGYGTKTIIWLKDYLFGDKNKIRIEGYTRFDNFGMRKCFTKAGFVKEGYLRSAWENEDGTASDCVVYGAIRSDWESGLTTPIKINDVPY
ncbi:GNAT family N-acetyltransferase [Ureibacillus acetophenoni]|uniref:RimJ/RimL family protein N-acetyltransferase n=1 Tax=Ureibacillus acetophenoni TaxID=614649 RepID=A0A285UHT1_9BACL|nr:GNAT family N-acetyltransferase [Ureibacillus acetophenoni]SOC39801.1 RimJ/RimL family protein N-acetyltransferase [Ureibacillus acetophenoni]